MKSETSSGVRSPGLNPVLSGLDSAAADVDSVISALAMGNGALPPALNVRMYMGMLVGASACIAVAREELAAGFASGALSVERRDAASPSIQAVGSHPCGDFESGAP